MRTRRVVAPGRMESWRVYAWVGMSVEDPGVPLVGEFVGGGFG